MSFQWNEESIAFRKDAASFVKNEKCIIDHVAPYFPAGANICDAGCGLGFLSLELARRGFSVTAVDTSALALSVLERNIAAEGATNITALQADAFTLPADTAFDGMFFSFFGDMPQTLAAARRCCRGTLVLVKKNYHTHRFSLTEKKLRRFTFAESCAYLDRAKIPYERETFAVEMGQPFRSLDDAMRFFALYDTQEPAPSRELLLTKLQTTNHSEFPYYLPMERSLGLIALQVRHITNSN